MKKIAFAVMYSPNVIDRLRTINNKFNNYCIFETKEEAIEYRDYMFLSSEVGKIKKIEIKL